MSKVRSRKVEIAQMSSTEVWVRFVRQRCQVRLPRRMFEHRLSMGNWSVTPSGPRPHQKTATRPKSA